MSEHRKSRHGSPRHAPQKAASADQTRKLASGRVGWASLGAERDISDLFPAERLIVWMMRCFAQGTTGYAIVEQQLYNMLPHDDVEPFLGAALRIHAGVDHLPCADTPDRRVTIEEERLLAFFFAAQMGASLYHALSAPLFKPAAQQLCLQETLRICETLSANALAMPSPPDLEPPCWRNGKPLPPVNLAARLSSGERLILLAQRYHALGEGINVPAQELIRGIFARHGLDAGAATATEDLLRALHEAGAPVRQVCAPDCPCLQEAERHVLTLISHANYGPSPYFQRSQPTAADHRIHNAATSLNAALRRGRLSIPRRQCQTPRWRAAPGAAHASNPMRQKKGPAT